MHKHVNNSAMNKIQNDYHNNPISHKMITKIYLIAIAVKLLELSNLLLRCHRIVKARKLKKFPNHMDQKFNQANKILINKTVMLQRNPQKHLRNLTAFQINIK